MKIHEYNQMMAYLTRPAVHDPSSTDQETRTADREPYYTGGRVGFKRGSGNPIPINAPTLSKFDDLIKNTDLTLKQIGREFGYAADLRSNSYIVKAYEESFGKIPEERFKAYKLTADSPQVIEGIKLFEEGMSRKAIAKKFGVDRKTLRNYFQQFKPEYIGEANVPTGEGKYAYKKKRAKIIKDLTEATKKQPGGQKILEEMKIKIDGILNKNDEVLKMTDEQILNNKSFKAAMNLDVKGINETGLKFDRYADLTPEEYVSKIRAMAKNRNFFQPEHFIPIKNKDVASLLPENIHMAIGKVGGQMEVLKDHIKDKKKYSSDAVKFLESQGIPITKTPGPIKKILSGAKKVAGKVITGALGPTGIVGLNVGLGADLKNTADRIGIEAEAALAPELVKASIGATKGMKNRSAQKFVQQLLNLGMKTPLALKVARVASPLGLVALGAEGAKFAYDDYQRRKEFITPETVTKAQQEQFDVNQPMFNEGGRVGYAKGPKDPSKRLFIKGVGALTMLPILGKYFKLAEPAAKVVGQYTGPVIEKVKGLEWVQFLAKRLWNEGDDVTKTAATMDGQVVRRGTLESGDEVDMIYDTRSGDVSFEVMGPKSVKEGLDKFQTKAGAYSDPYSVDYKAPQIIEETGKKTKPTIEVSEARPRQVAESEIELDGDIFDVDDALSDLTELEAFAKKKFTKEIHKTKGTKPKKTSPDFEGPEPDLDDFDID